MSTSIAERHEDLAEVLPLPRGRPGGDGPLADGQRVVRHHRPLGHLVDPAQAVALGAGPLGGVGRERLGVEEGLAGRVVAGRE